MTYSHVAFNPQPDPPRLQQAGNTFIPGDQFGLPGNTFIPGDQFGIPGDQFRSANF